MKSKDKSSRKKSTRTKGAPRTKRTIPGDGTRRTSKPIEARFKAVFESSRDAIGVSKSGIHVFVNPAYLELFGFPAGADLAGKPVLDLIAPESRDQVKDYILRRVQGEVVPSTYETRGMRSDGSAFDMEVNVSLYQEGGQDHTLVILRDITQRKMQEEEIAERGAMMRQIMDTASVAIFLVDRSGRIVHANSRMAKMFGCSLEDLVGSEYVDHVHPSERETGRQKMLALLASEIPSVDLERLYWRKDGTQFWGHLAGQRFHDIHGGELGLVGVITDIDKRKQAEDLVSASEKKFSAIFGLIPDPTTITDIETGKILDLNDPAARWFGHSREEAIGMTTAEVQVWEDPSDRDRLIQKIRAKGVINDMSFRLRMHDGEIREVLISSRMIEIGGKQHMLSRVHDITELKRAAEVLRISEEKFRKVFLTSPDSININRLQDGMYISINQGFTSITGYTAADVIGKTSVELNIWDDPADRQKLVEGLRKQGEVKNLEARFRSKDGRIIDGLMSASLIEIDHIPHLVNITRDITERKRSELALIQSERKYRRLYNETPVLLHSIDRDGNVVEVNDYWLMTMGYERSEVSGRKVTDFYTEASRKYAQNVVQPAFFRDGVVKDIAYQFVKKNGVVIDVLLTASSERDAAGNVVRSQAVIEDVTERKRMEEALHENQAQLDLAMQSAHMGVWRWEIRENRRYFDDLVCQLLGIDASTFTGTSEEFLRVVHPEDREKIQAAIARTLEQDVLYEPTYRAVWPDGSIHYVTARGKMIRDDKGQPTRVNGILWDITEQRLLEQEIIKSQKLESIGTLAGGIAHDFNNLLQGIFGYIAMAKLTLGQKEKSLSMLEQAEKALHQSVNLTTQLLTFSKGGKPIKKIIALRPMIESTVGFALSGSRSTYEIVSDDDLRAVEADEGQIGQVIQNIVLNADQAMPLGGMIRVSARNRSAAGIVPHVDLEGDLVEISIQDQGTGISAEHLTKIFDPYFTTKEKGSGLGLTTSYSIIKNHGGLLHAQSDIGKGTTLSIYLPASRAHREAQNSPAISAAARMGRILIMDDEEMIRAVVGELLTSIGHEVAFAEKGETALEMYRAARDAERPFDVVILDLTIRGGLGGMETLRKLLEINPDIKAVVSSGYSDDAALSNYREQGFRAFLKKPYNLEELQSTLNSLLA
jgi:PAS domain S-box-containing protein